MRTPNRWAIPSLGLAALGAGCVFIYGLPDLLQDFPVPPWKVVAVLAAGIGAGAINAVVGSGSLITFPTLLAVGLPPITANVSNNVGLVPGGVAGVMGYRAELKGQRDRIVRLAS